MNFFVIQATRENWKWGILDYFFKISKYTAKENVLLFGFNKERLYQNVNVGDKVLFKVNKNGSDDYGIIGIGEVVEKFEDREKYWPDEFKSMKSYPWRIKIGNIRWVKNFEERVKNLKIDFEKWKNNIDKFFESDEFSGLDIFKGFLIKKSYRRGTLIKISEEEVNEIEKLLNLEVSSLSQGIIAKDFEEFVYKVYENEKRLAFDSLLNGKNVIFIGPPGSGKTLLAIKVSEEFSKERNGNGYLLYTVHSGTDYFDLVARIIPSVEKGKLVYKKEKRYLLEALLNKKLLILDEINRTQIDTALGIFFTYLEREHRLRDAEKIKEIIEKEIGENIVLEDLKSCLEFFRVIGTLNIYDKTFLFKIGDALRRRFVFINIGTSKEKINIIKENFETFLNCINFEGDEELARKLFSIFERINEKKELGIGILKELILFSMNYEDEKEAIEKSLIHTVLNFFENDPKWMDIEEILKEEGLKNAIEYLRSLNYVFTTS